MNARVTRSKTLPFRKLKTKKKATEKIEKIFVSYDGKIVYKETFVDCAEICDKLMKDVAVSESVVYYGFDMEWPFNFNTGPGKTAVIQINTSLDLCYIFHVFNVKSLPKALIELLIHPNLRLSGVNIKCDIRKLARDFPGIDGDKIIDNCIELSTMANEVFLTKMKWSMEKLVDKIFEMAINKDKRVRMSKWHITPLTNEQLRYAAIDSYMSLKMYWELKQKSFETDTYEL